MKNRENSIFNNKLHINSLLDGFLTDLRLQKILVKSQMNVFKKILCRAYSIKNKLISPKCNLTYLKAPNPTAHQFTD